MLATSPPVKALACALLLISLQVASTIAASGVVALQLSAGRGSLTRGESFHVPRKMPNGVTREALQHDKKQWSMCQRFPEPSLFSADAVFSARPSTAGPRTGRSAGTTGSFRLPDMNANGATREELMSNRGRGAWEACQKFRDPALQAPAADHRAAARRSNGHRVMAAAIPSRCGATSQGRVGSTRRTTITRI